MGEDIHKDPEELEQRKSLEEVGDDVVDLPQLTRFFNAKYNQGTGKDTAQVLPTSTISALVHENDPGEFQGESLRHEVVGDIPISQKMLREYAELRQHDVFTVDWNGSEITVDIGPLLYDFYLERVLDMDRPGFPAYVLTEYGSLDHYVESLTMDLGFYLHQTVLEDLQLFPDFKVEDIEKRVKSKVYLESVLDDFLYKKMVPVVTYEGEVQRYYYEISGGIAEHSSSYLGHGGFGEVFLAHAFNNLGKEQVVVKRAKYKGKQALEFESKILDEMMKDDKARPYVVECMGVSKGAMYIAMEELEPLEKYGYPHGLATFSDEQLQAMLPFYQEEVLRELFQHLEEGLRMLHQKGYAHCDVKPANIGMDTHGVAKYMDMGGMVSKEDLHDDTLDRVGVTLGYGFLPVLYEALNKGDVSLLQDMDWFALSQTMYEVVMSGIIIQNHFQQPSFSKEFLQECNNKLISWRERTIKHLPGEGEEYVGRVLAYPKGKDLLSVWRKPSKL